MTRKHSNPDGINDYSVELGAVFDGHRIVRPNIASGGSGIIHEAIDPKGRRCALKILHRDCILNDINSHYKAMGCDDDAAEKKAKSHYERYVRFFKSEYKRLVGISHPNVAEAYDFGFAQGHFYFTSEFIEGVTIAEYTDRMEPVKMIPLFIQVLQGLDFIHRTGLIHLDIKSENVLVQEIDGKPRVKLIDFGLTMPIEDYGGEPYGSYHYMAPEVAFGKKELVDARADLFSFGVLMFFCLCWGIGYPFPRTAKRDPEALRRCVEREVITRLPSSIHERRPGTYPIFYDEMLKHLLSKKPEDRFYGNARAVINALLTKSPDSFSDSSESRGAYLIPEGNRHIGREEEQERIREIIEGLLSNSNQPRIILIGGSRGIGKSHLLSKAADLVKRNAESIDIAEIDLPTEDTHCSHWADKATAILSEGDKPSVIIVDDFHEALSTIDEGDSPRKFAKIKKLVKRAAKHIAERRRNPEMYEDARPIFMCLSFNDEEIDVDGLFKSLGVDRDEFEYYKLSPLSADEVAKYLESTPALKTGHISNDRIAELHSITGGMPSEIREHLEAVDSRGLLFDLEGNVMLSLPPKWRRESPPKSTGARLIEAYRALDDNERAIMKYMAVWQRHGIAEDVKYDDISRLLFLPALRQELNALVGKGMLVHSLVSDSYVFRQDVYFPSLIYGSLGMEEAEQIHGKMAMILSGDAEKEDLFLLHHSHSSNSADAFRSLLRLTKNKLYRDGDIHITQELCRHALERIPKDNPNLFACFSVIMSNSYIHEGRYVDALDAVNRALEKLSAADSGHAWIVSLLFQKASALLRMRDFDSFYDTIMKAFNLLREYACFSSPNVQYISLLNIMARALYERALVDGKAGRDWTKRAQRVYAKSRILEESFPEQAVARIVNNDEGLILLALGAYGEAAERLETQISRHRNNAYHFGILYTSMTLATAYRFMGMFDKSVSLAESAAQYAKKSYQGKWLLFAHQNLAYTYHDMDKFEKAIVEDDRWLASSNFLEDAKEHRRTQRSVWNHKGHCYKELGKFNKAILHFQTVLDSKPDTFSMMYANEGLGESYFNMGNMDRSDEHLSRAYKLLKEMPPDSAESYRFPIGRFRAEVMLAKGKTTEARTMLSEIEPLAGTNDVWKKQYLSLKNRLRRVVS